jgi:hypothetical protein
LGIFNKMRILVIRVLTVSGHHQENIGRITDAGARASTSKAKKNNASIANAVTGIFKLFAITSCMCAFSGPFLARSIGS